MDLELYAWAQREFERRATASGFPASPAADASQKRGAQQIENSAQR
jgi:hypothetical protein